MSILTELRGAKGVVADCPGCGETFSLRDSDLFDATRPLKGRGLEHLRLREAELREEITAFETQKVAAMNRSRTGALRIGIGKMVEKIAPSLPGFPLLPADCRSLLEPLDFIAFPGLASKGVVDALVFVDVKSGRARLTGTQRMVRSVVEHGNVSLVLTDVRSDQEKR